MTRKAACMSLLAIAASGGKLIAQEPTNPPNDQMLLWSNINPPGIGFAYKGRKAIATWDEIMDSLIGTKQGLYYDGQLGLKVKNQ